MVWIYLHVNNTNPCTFPLQATDVAQWQEPLLDETMASSRLCCSVLHGDLTGERDPALSLLDPQNLLVAEREQQHL